MKTCSASERISEVKGEIQFMEGKIKDLTTDLETKRKELAELESAFKIPGFFRNMTVEPVNEDYLAMPKDFDKDRGYHTWMYNEMQKLGMWNKLDTPTSNPVFVFINEQIETMYNHCVENYTEMAGYPVFPKEFIKG
jgi:hypothetical protein